MKTDSAAIVAGFDELGCAALQDAAPQYCVVLNPAPVRRVPGLRICGPAFPVATPNDMLPCLQALDASSPGDVLYIRNTGPQSHALIGDIFATAARRRGLSGVVVEGAVRDIDGLAAIGLPVFSTEVTFVSAKTAQCKAATLPQALSVDDYRPAYEPFVGRRTEIKPGDWVFGDADGMLVVPARFVSAVLAAARILDQRERELKSALRGGEELGAIIGLRDFLAGSGSLKFAV